MTDYKTHPKDPSDKSSRQLPDKNTVIPVCFKPESISAFRIPAKTCTQCLSDGNDNLKLCGGIPLE